jgi:succinate dehydrogenase/fumarate reductase-like Fe-S protein
MTNAQRMQMAIEKLNEAKELMIEALGEMEFVMDHVVNIETMIDELEYYRQEELENE